MITEGVYFQAESNRYVYASYRGPYGGAVNFRQLNTTSATRLVGRRTHTSEVEMKENDWNLVPIKDLNCVKCQKCSPKLIMIDGYIEPANKLMCWTCAE